MCEGGVRRVELDDKKLPQKTGLVGKLSGRLSNLRISLFQVFVCKELHTRFNSFSRLVGNHV